ncbi:MAG: hypothetical protein ACRDEA_19365 [Microcystaceae cyanobacterium]
MLLDPKNPQPTLLTNTNVLSPTDIIEAMLDLRIQADQLSKRIQALQPAFSAACVSLNTDKIQLERAIVARKLTPGQWTYSLDILQHEDLLRQRKRQFQLHHEPTGGREVSWTIRLLLENVRS